MSVGVTSGVLFHGAHLLVDKFLEHFSAGGDWAVVGAFSGFEGVLVDGSVSETLHDAFACGWKLLDNFLTFVLVVFVKSIPFVDFLEVSANFDYSFSHKIKSVFRILSNQFFNIIWKMNQIIILYRKALYLACSLDGKW